MKNTCQSVSLKTIELEVNLRLRPSLDGFNQVIKMFGSKFSVSRKRSTRVVKCSTIIYVGHNRWWKESVVKVMNKLCSHKNVVTFLFIIKGEKNCEQRVMTTGHNEQEQRWRHERGERQQDSRRQTGRPKNEVK